MKNRASWHYLLWYISALKRCTCFHLIALWLLPSFYCLNQRNHYNSFCLFIYALRETFYSGYRFCDLLKEFSKSKTIIKYMINLPIQWGLFPYVTEELLNKNVRTAWQHPDYSTSAKLRVTHTCVRTHWHLETWFQDSEVASPPNLLKMSM